MGVRILALILQEDLHHIACANGLLHFDGFDSGLDRQIAFSLQIDDNRRNYFISIVSLEAKHGRNEHLHHHSMLQ